MSVAAYHSIHSVFNSLTGSVFFYRPTHQQSSRWRGQGSQTTKTRRKDDEEDKDDKGKGQKEEQEVEGTIACSFDSTPDRVSLGKISTSPLLGTM